jgi:peptidoglycan/LPS O-acetylase OafA/YrhL
MMDTIPSTLVVILGVLAFIFGIAFLMNGRRLLFAAGWLLARWISEESWRPVAACIVLGLVTLAIAVWSARLDTLGYFFLFLMALGAFVVGVTGIEERVDGESNAPALEWRWRRNL